ncbi:MAG: tetratricopeptide repeat protein [Thermodesulfovibrionales bacterium]
MMKILSVLPIIMMFFIFEAYASMPVEVTMTGCVIDGKFTKEVTDFGTHKVKGSNTYLIKIIDKDRKPIDLRGYNGMRLSIKGFLTPGDYLYTDSQSIKVMGDCVEKSEGQGKRLTLKEQERLAKDLFLKMSKTDASDTKVFIELYGRVIDECPDTERAQEAYWRLSNLYLQAFDQPQYDKIARLLEEAVKKYPNTPATPHYKQRLLRAYEATKQWQKAVALYEEALIGNPEILSDPQNAATMIDYANALIGSGNKEKALSILNKVVSFGDKIEDWLIEVAKWKLEEIK